jgi:K+-transporting ATPase KdpF subunit
MNITILSTLLNPSEVITSEGYTIGAIIALLILAYLIYALLKPEKF